MDSNTISIGLTAGLGVVGIVSTHLLAQSQRKADTERVKGERQDRYRFSEYEARSTLYADYVAELRTLLLRARLRLSVVPNARRKMLSAGEAARVDAAKTTDENLRSALNAFAHLFDSDSSFRRSVVTNIDEGLPEPVDTLPIAHRLAELEARIQLIATNEMAQAAAAAQDAAISFMMQLQASEFADFDRLPPLDELEQATAKVEEAAIYELRLHPYGEQKSLSELRSMAERGLDPGSKTPT